MTLQLTPQSESITLGQEPIGYAVRYSDGTFHRDNVLVRDDVEIQAICIAPSKVGAAGLAFNSEDDAQFEIVPVYAGEPQPVQRIASSSPTDRQPRRQVLSLDAQDDLAYSFVKELDVIRGMLDAMKSLEQMDSDAQAAKDNLRNDMLLDSVRDILGKVPDDLRIPGGDSELSFRLLLQAMVRVESVIDMGRRIADHLDEIPK